jgi:hypothetical protein
MGEDDRFQPETDPEWEGVTSEYDPAFDKGTRPETGPY